MAAALSDAQLQAVQQQLSAHPEILQAIQKDNQLFQHQGRQAYVLKNGAKGPADILKQYGIDFPDAGDYQIQQQPDGSVTLKRQNWFQRNADWILPVATIGTGGVANAAAAGGAVAPVAPTAATTGGTTAGAAAPLAADEVFSAGPVAGSGMAGVDTAGMVAPAASTGFGAALKSALPSIIGAGASVGGAAIAAHGNTEAAKIQAASADKALAQAKEIYQQNVARQAPFVGIGTSALGPLSFGMGLPDPNVKAAADAAANPPASSSVAPGAVDASGKPMAGAGANQAPVTPPTYAQQTSASLNSLGQSGTVRMLNPQTGQIHLIPPDQVSQALASGGVRA